MLHTQVCIVVRQVTLTPVQKVILSIMYVDTLGALHTSFAVSSSQVLADLALVMVSRVVNVCQYEGEVAL